LRSPAPYSALFALGYLAAWSAFALAATALQAGLERLALLDRAGMSLTSSSLAGTVLIAAGLFQWSRFKDACLTQCRTPVGFFMGFWREGHGGALAMGLHHGLYCVGCCWALMAVMFVVGTMNMLWIAILTAAMLFEKLGPAGDAVGRVIGAALVLAGGWQLLS
jgi:predicted metal-binding membrane protein